MEGEEWGELRRGEGSPGPTQGRHPRSSPWLTEGLGEEAEASLPLKKQRLLGADKAWAHLHCRSFPTPPNTWEKFALQMRLGLRASPAGWGGGGLPPGWGVGRGCPSPTPSAEQPGDANGLIKQQAA